MNYPEGYLTYDSFIPHYIKQLNAEMGEDYSVTLVPELSVFLLLAGGMVALFGWMKIKFKNNVEIRYGARLRI